MKKSINFKPFLKINQPKLFNIYQLPINEEDDVFELSEIMEGLNYDKFMQVFKHKTKVHPIRLLAVILFAYSRKVTSTREIEQLCRENIKFRYLLANDPIPDHSTISRFLKKAEPEISQLFIQFTNKLLEINSIDTDIIYIDGTKIEANANKYSFVWKKAVLKFKENLLLKIDEFIDDFNNNFKQKALNLSDIISALNSKKILKVYGKGSRKSTEQKYLDLAEKYLNKLNEYENHLSILGERNSYSKTDYDATFMRMKEDHMANGQLKPGYNLQIGVCSEFIISSAIFPNPTDIKTLIPFLDKIKNQGFKLKNIVADAGYESLENYQFLKKNNLTSYIKPQTFEKSKSKKFTKDLNRIENLIFDVNTSALKFADGVELKYIKDASKNGIKYKIYYNQKTDKNIWYNYEFRTFSKKSKENIMTEKGKQLRMNRSIQVEGAFAVIKEDMKLRKLKISGFKSVEREILLICMGYNFKIHMYKKKHLKKGNILHELKIA